MIIAKKSNEVRERSTDSFDLKGLLQAVRQTQGTPFKYMGLQADNLNGFLGALKLIAFELLQMYHLRLVLPGRLASDIDFERRKFNAVVTRSERGRVVFDCRGKKYTLRNNQGELNEEPCRYLANRVAEVQYSFVPGTRTICFDGINYTASDSIQMVATSEFAFAVAGGKNIELFQGGNTYQFPIAAKKICFGAEGLFFVNQDNELWIVKEFRHGVTKYEARPLTDVYPNLISDSAELVACDNLMCVVYRTQSNVTKIEIVNGRTLSYQMDPQMSKRVLHFGAFYWQRTLTVYYILDQQDGLVSECLKKTFNIF